MLLNDNVAGPKQPDLSNSSHVGMFAAWTDHSKNYLGLVPTVRPSTISTIDIYFYNNPKRGISLPNFELCGLQRYVPTIIPEQYDQQLSFDLINNGQLSQEDEQVRKVTLRLRNPASYSAYLLRWNFNSLFGISWFLLSELTLCGDLPLPTYPSTNLISFIAPSNDTTPISPQMGLMGNGSLVLKCTVSNDGHFKWKWREGVLVNLQDGDPGIQIFSADGTRSSVLITSALKKSVSIHCDASFTAVISYFERIFDISVFSKYTCVCFHKHSAIYFKIQIVRN